MSSTEYFQQRLKESGVARRGIVAAGTWLEDIIKVVDGWPAEEQVAQILDTARQGGGSAHNLGVDIKRLDPGMSVEAICLLGQDAAGDFLMHQASIAGIDCSQIHRTAQCGSSFTDVISDSSTGKRTFFYHRGTADLLSPKHFDFSKTQGKFLHLGLLGLHKLLDEPWQQEVNGWVAILKAAREHGLLCNLELVSISPQRLREVARPCLEYLDLLIINEFELGALADMTVTDPDSQVDAAKIIAAAHHVMSMGKMELLVVHYPANAIVLHRIPPDEEIRIVQSRSFAIPETLLKGAVGAGDAFAAGMLYAIHEGWSLEEALELAHATAAASLRAPDTVSAVESASACLAFARQFSRA